MGEGCLLHVALLDLARPSFPLEPVLFAFLSEAAEAPSYLVVQDVDPDAPQASGPEAGIVGLLSLVYGTAARIGYALTSSLVLDFTILLAPFCGHDPFCIPSLARVFSVSTQLESFREAVNRKRRLCGLQEAVFSTVSLPRASSPPGPLASLDRSKASHCMLPDKINAYDYVALGGTFDRLHVGHKLLLSQAALIAKKGILCGVSGTVLAVLIFLDVELISQKAYLDRIQPISIRMSNVASFVRLFRSGIQIKCTALHDTVGPAASDPTLQVVIVSRETVAGAHLVNARRGEMNLSPLEIVVVDLVSALAVRSESTLDDSIRNKISSTEIRKRMLE